jgi:hypothetical protein
VDILPDGGSDVGRPSAYASWLGDFAARGFVPQFLTLSVPTGIAFGLLTGGRDMSLGEGMAAGIFFGLFFGGTMTALVQHRMRPLRGLSSVDRRQIAALVRNGETTIPPHLAADVITYCNIIQRAQSRPQTAQRTNRLLVVLAGLVLLGALAHPRPSELVVDVLIALLLLNRVRKGSGRRELMLANATATERAASALLLR